MLRNTCSTDSDVVPNILEEVVSAGSDVNKLDLTSSKLRLVCIVVMVAIANRGAVTQSHLNSS